MTNSLLPEINNHENRGLFIACAASVLAAHTAMWLAEEKMQYSTIIKLDDPLRWMQAFDKAIKYDAVLLTPAIGAYAYYQLHKKKPDS